MFKKFSLASWKHQPPCQPSPVSLMHVCRLAIGQTHIMLKTNTCTYTIWILLYTIDYNDVRDYGDTMCNSAWHILNAGGTNSDSGGSVKTVSLISAVTIFTKYICLFKILGTCVLYFFNTACYDCIPRIQNWPFPLRLLV